MCPSNSKPFLKLAEISPGPVTAISDGLTLLQSIFFPVTKHLVEDGAGEPGVSPSSAVFWRGAAPSPNC